jgi:hypothetical protein
VVELAEALWVAVEVAVACVVGVAAATLLDVAAATAAPLVSSAGDAVDESLRPPFINAKRGRKLRMLAERIADRMRRWRSWWDLAVIFLVS